MSDTPKSCKQRYIESVGGRAHMSAVEIITELEAKLAAAEKVISDIHQWCDAYPVDVFPEPDFELVRIALESRGLTVADDESEDDAVDAVSASNMRHVLNGVREIIDAATGKAKEGE